MGFLWGPKEHVSPDLFPQLDLMLPCPIPLSLESFTYYLPLYN